MLVISGCGRQVTGLNAPNASALLPEGQTLIRFDTAMQVNKNYFKPATNTTLSNAGAQITGIEVFSQPPNGPVVTSAPSATPTSSATRAP